MEFGEDYLTIDDLFVSIQRAINHNMDVLAVTYGEEQGLPAHETIDWETNAGMMNSHGK